MRGITQNITHNKNRIATIASTMLTCRAFFPNRKGLTDFMKFILGLMVLLLCLLLIVEWLN